MSKRKELDLSIPYQPEPIKENQFAELSEEDKRAFIEQIKGTKESYVVAHVGHILARPGWEGMEKSGGDMLARQGFTEDLLNKLLILDNPIIRSQKEKIVADIDLLLKSNLKAGEEVTEEIKAKLAKEIVQIIHATTETK